MFSHMEEGSEAESKRAECFPQQVKQGGKGIGAEKPTSAED